MQGKITLYELKDWIEAIAELVRAGIIFVAHKSDSGAYVIELTGGY